MFGTVEAHMMWLRLLAVGPLLLLLALLPSLVYLGHWGELAGRAPAEQSDADHEAHHSHCHVDLESCGDQPAPPGPQGFGAVVDLPANHSVSTALVEHMPTLVGRAVPPLVEPPRSVV